jgi:FXSXX-COOH protein
MVPIPEPDVVTHLPKVTELPPDEWLTGDGSVLSNAIRRLLAAADRPEEAISAFNNYPSQRVG